MPLERIEPTSPLRSVRLEPCVELHQRFRPQSVQPALGIPSDLDQPGVAQHLEMTGHTRLVHPDLRNQVIDRPLTLANRIEDPPPGRFGDHLEHVEHSRHGR